MLRSQTLSMLLTAVLLATACKKEVETLTVEVPAQTAWQEVKTLRNLERIVLGMSQNGSSVFLVQPGRFTTLTGTARRQQSINLNNGVSTNLNVRAGLNRNFFATPVGDSTIAVFRTDYGVGTAGAYLRVNRLDPTIRGFHTQGSMHFPAVAINDNNYLLASYYTTAAPQAPINFVLAQAERGSTPSDGPVLRPGRRVTLPMPAGTNFSQLLGMYAIDDYFLVSLLPGGVYKIYENGSYRRVSDDWASRAIYKWQGRLYMIGQSAQMSVDNGDSWQPLATIPLELVDSKPFAVGDSLVAAVGDQLVSWNWRWQTNSVRIRPLNTEGLERSTITGVQLLRDTVYVGTTNGLFVRPVSKFFESRVD